MTDNEKIVKLLMEKETPLSLSEEQIRDVLAILDATEAVVNGREGCFTDLYGKTAVDDNEELLQDSDGNIVVLARDDDLARELFYDEGISVYNNCHDNGIVVQIVRHKIECMWKNLATQVLARLDAGETDDGEFDETQFDHVGIRQQRHVLIEHARREYMSEWQLTGATVRRFKKIADNIHTQFGMDLACGLEVNDEAFRMTWYNKDNMETEVLLDFPVDASDTKMIQEFNSKRFIGISPTQRKQWQEIIDFLWEMDVTDG